MLRGQARSYKECTGLHTSDIPVGAGLPAKQPTPTHMTINQAAAAPPACPCGRPSASPARSAAPGSSPRRR
ncbi:hypothetical protein E2H86_09510 [Pseudomonas putida]|nr:hypothetical protein E2H86_09510 [Pseudomonas putida]